MKKNVINVLVENHFGVLAQVVGLFSSRGYNISSLVVGETEDPSLSSMTIVVEGNESVVEQVIKQLNKLIEVIKVINLTHVESISRELALMKISAVKADRGSIISVINAMNGTIIEIKKDYILAEFTGDEARVENAIEIMRSYGIKELIKTGKVALSK